jgi:hypothetical protein
VRKREMRYGEEVHDPYRLPSERGRGSVSDSAEKDGEKKTYSLKSRTMAIPITMAIAIAAKRREMKRSQSEHDLLSA